ncbi:MAG TPA: hypothetical protein VGG63_10200 [Steroidobacteraceae bacterium]
MATPHERLAESLAALEKLQTGTKRVLRSSVRARYLRALDKASIDLDIEPFASLLAERLQESITKAR